jgi:hypothetical protein
MGLSKRERMIVLVTVISVGALVADRFIRAPLANGLGALKSDRDQAVTKVQKAKLLIRQSEQAQQRMTQAGGLQSDTEAESRVAKALDKWSEEAGLSLTSVKPDRMAGDKGVKEIVFVVAGKGPLDAVALFLYQVETSELPLKVKSMQLGSASEAGDSMSLELRLSTLYLAADSESASPTRSGAAGRQSQPKPKETNDEEPLL